MRFLYPADSFSPKKVDEIYEEEYVAAREAGWPVSIFNFEDFQTGAFQTAPKIDESEVVLYRGWMLNGNDYQRLHNAIIKNGGVPVTSSENYLLCHHLPNWYPMLRDWTAETMFFSEGDDIACALSGAGWKDCFLKDYVKSLSTDGGSLVRDLSVIPSVIAKMKKYRGQIEGGLCARRVENYEPESERRYFVFQGRAFGDDEIAPQPVLDAAKVISSPFFAVDLARTTSGELRIVELGDGQVSDRKH